MTSDPSKKRRTPESSKVRAPKSGDLGLIRVQKILAAAGFASRRGAEELIREGRVTINGRTAGLGDKADPLTDDIAFDGERIRPERPQYWAINKPVGLVTTVRDPHGRATVMQLLPDGVGRVHPVGRLDRDSSGLLLMTNDGDLTQRLLHPSHVSEKEYRVIAKGNIESKVLERLRRGVRLDDGPSAPVGVSSVRYDPDSETTTLNLTLTEGRKRQIRRTLLQLGHPVRKLKRIRVGPLRLGRLGTGAARPLTGPEIVELKRYASQLDRAKRPGRSRRHSAGPGL